MSEELHVERKGRSTTFESNRQRDGVQLCISHRGVEVFGWYDSIVGIEPIQISLDDLEAALKNARRKR
jgi:hypothetical protein